MTVTPAMEEHATRKLQKLERYFDHIIDVHVVASLLRNWHVVEITLKANGVVLRAEERTGDMYQSIDEATNKLERQLKRHKDKLHSRSRGAIRAQVPPPAETEEDAATEEEHAGELAPIVRTKSIPVKPMSPEEATLQMELVGHDFFVFSNADTELINVVYRRKDGNYGLIEPEE